MKYARAATVLALAGAVAVGSTGGCASDEEDPVARCESEPVSQFQELMVVDEAVIDDARAKNATGGPWSFRHSIENMVPDGVDTSVFIRSWLLSWVTTREVNGFRTDKPTEERDATMQAIIMCPWLKRTPENACNEDCSMCTGGYKLDLATAPFRLLAIVNRMDLRDEVAAEPNGEGRLVYALTEGPGDDPASVPRAMSVIFEYALPDTRSAREWASTWHELGKISGFDEPYRVALENVTNSFTKRGSNPAGRNGSALGQVRTNESVLNWIWQQREFGLDPAGMLMLRPVRNTPGEALNGSDTLKKYILENQEAIFANRYEIPDRMRAGSADQLVYVWAVPGVEPKLRRAFAAGTCNGCHSSENPNIDTAFHVSPFRKGTAKLSPFVYSGSPGDELSRRSHVTARIRCTGE